MFVKVTVCTKTKFEFLIQLDLDYFFDFGLEATLVDRGQ